MTKEFLPIDTGFIYPSSSLRKIAADTCATLFVISSIFSNGTTINFPTSNLSPDIGVISTYVPCGYRYNSGNIDFFIEGIATMDAKLWSNLKKLDEIAALKYNWNENGAGCFSEEIIASMRTIISCLVVQPSIFPTARASIQFEYEKNNGDYLEFELFENGNLKKFFFSSSGESSSAFVKVEEINTIVDEFYKN